MTAEPINHDRRHARIRFLAISSIVVAFVVMAIKYAAYLVTGSVALYSDALESIVNVVAAAVALIAITIGARPPDKQHPFGHHKAELFSATLEGALIIVAAMLVLAEAYAALINPRVLTEPVTGMLINGVATALNAGWSLYLIRQADKLRSAALAADGRHILADVWTSVGVLAGIMLATATGWYILDPLLACAVAINILWVGYKIVRGSLSGLMDEAASPKIQAEIRDAIKIRGGGALEAHDIRTRYVGPVTFIEFHLVVPGEMSVRAAHDICDRIEQELAMRIEGAEILIHVEPDFKAKGSEGSTVLI